MTNSTGKALEITKYFPSLPSAQQSFTILFLLSFLTGIAGGLFTTLGGFSFFDVIWWGAKGVTLITVPSLIASALLFIRKKIPPKRLVFLALISGSIYALFYLLMNILPVVIPVSADELFAILLLGYGVACALWYVVANLFFGFSRRSALAYSFFQLIFNLTMWIFLRELSLSRSAPASLLLFILIPLVFIVGVYAILWFINAPVQRNFGVSGTVALSSFISQWLEQGDELEELFDEVGEIVETSVTALVLKTPSTRALFIVPHVHYGPFGTLGGSAFPQLLTAHFRTRGYEPFVFHGLATHDFNPVSDDQLSVLISALEPALASVTVTPARGHVIEGTEGDEHVRGIRFGTRAWVYVTRAPHSTEDIDYAWQLIFASTLREHGVSEPFIFDAHNADTGDLARIETGSPIGFSYLRALVRAFKERREETAVRFGWAHLPVKSPRIAGAGAKVFVFEIGGEKYAYLLFDANGITPLFIERLRRELKLRGYQGDAFTTDTHVINTVAGVVNPLGVDEEENTRILRALDVLSSIRPEPLDIGFVSVPLRIKVFGTKHSAELVGMVNAIAAIMKIAAPVMFLAITAFAFLLARKLLEVLV